MIARLTLTDASRARWARAMAGNGAATVRATVRALNKGARKAATGTGRELAAVLGIPVRPVRRRLIVVRASKRKQRAKVWCGVLPLAASKLGKVRTLRSGAAVGRKRFPGSFVAKMPNGHVGVFARSGRQKKRKPPKYNALTIVEQAINLYPAAAPILRRHTDMAMATTVPRELIRLLKLNAARVAR